MSRQTTHTLRDECPSPYSTNQEDRTAARMVALEISRRRDLSKDASLGGCMHSHRLRENQLGTRSEDVCAIFRDTGYGTAVPL